MAALLEKLVDVTDGSFVLEPTDAIVTAEHVAASVRWHAERGGRQVAGYDLAVFRVADGKIAEAWFFPDGFDLDELSEVFSFASGA